MSKIKQKYKNGLHYTKQDTERERERELISFIFISLFFVVAFRLFFSSFYTTNLSSIIPCTVPEMNDSRINIS
jgi:hypothetical protein